MISICFLAGRTRSISLLRGASSVRSSQVLGTSTSSRPRSFHLILTRCPIESSLVTRLFQNVTDRRKRTTIVRLVRGIGRMVHVCLRCWLFSTSPCFSPFLLFGRRPTLLFSTSPCSLPSWLFGRRPTLLYGCSPLPRAPCHFGYSDVGRRSCHISKAWVRRAQRFNWLDNATVAPVVGSGASGVLPENPETGPWSSCVLEVCSLYRTLDPRIYRRKGRPYQSV
jgi:hypothetical protein